MSKLVPKIEIQKRKSREDDRKFLSQSPMVYLVKAEAKMCRAM